MSVSKIIKMTLSTSSIKDGIAELKSFKASLDQKKNKMLGKLADIGLREASIRFTTAIYDGVNDSHVTLKPIDNGYAIVAEGHAVAFIEFGAGVYHNPGEPYPDLRPAGIVGIGEYGQGKGKQNTWVFRDEAGEKVFTHGNPAAMPMWYASEEMRSKITQIAKEVFG